VRFEIFGRHWLVQRHDEAPANLLGTGVEADVGHMQQIELLQQALQRIRAVGRLFDVQDDARYLANRRPAEGLVRIAFAQGEVLNVLE